MSDRTDGVMFGSGDDVFFVPAEALDNFKIDSSLLGGDDVEGFGKMRMEQKMRPRVKPISWGFEGPIMRPTTKGNTYSLAPTAT